MSAVDDIQKTVCKKLKNASNEFAKIRNYNYHMLEASNSIKLYLSFLNKYITPDTNKLTNPKNPKICNQIFRNMNNFSEIATNISEDFERLNKKLNWTDSDSELYNKALRELQNQNATRNAIVFGCHFEKINLLIRTIRVSSDKFIEQLSELEGKLESVQGIPNSKCKLVLKQTKILIGLMKANKIQLDESVRILSLMNPIDADSPENVPRTSPSRRSRSRKPKFAPALSDILEEGSLSRSSSTSRTRRSREKSLSKSSSSRTRRSREKDPSPQNVFANMINKYKPSDIPPLQQNVFGKILNMGTSRPPSLPRQTSTRRIQRRQD